MVTIETALSCSKQGLPGSQWPVTGQEAGSHRAPADVRAPRGSAGRAHAAISVHPSYPVFHCASARLQIDYILPHFWL